MQVLDLLQSCGVAKQDHQLAELFQITSVADELFPCMQNFFTPTQSSVLALTCLAARAVNLPNTEWQDHQFPKEPYTMQRLPPPGGSILINIGEGSPLQLSFSDQTSCTC